MDYFKYQFNEDTWTIYLIEDDDNVVADEDAAAETKFEEKEIYFRKSELSESTVRHELWHVYFGYCYLMDATSISTHDIEEITASLFADKGSKIIEKSIEVHKKLVELLSKKEE